MIMSDHKGAESSTAFYYRWRKGGSPDELRERFASGVSLHSHTWHSFESLAFLPNAVQKMYFLPVLLRWGEKRYERKWKQSFDYEAGYWTSPVSPAAAERLESNQIKSVGLAPLLSFTDHDSITAPRELANVPISLEWTAPYKGAIFHIGVHNVPSAKGDSVLDMLTSYTAKPDPAALGPILAELASFPDSLIVFNHPLSDQGRIGFEIHSSRVREFLETHRQWLHALEVNAMQPWHMNRRVAAIAKETNLPLVAGGDRHGFEPNGAINMSSAKTFGAFAHEIRDEKKSAVLFMPQSRRSLKLRYAENVKAIMDDYEDLPGRRFWYDRVFYRCPDGVTRSFTELIGYHTYAFEAMQLAVSALGLANLALRPITPVFAEGHKEIP
jgi:hypothetical protein